MEERNWHRSYDEGVPTSIDYEDLPLSGFLARSARDHGARPALAFLNGALTYAQLDDHVRRFATALARLGVAKGTRVGIQLPNLPQTVIAYFAVQHLGAVAVMTNPLYTPREIQHQWTDAGCEVVVLADFIWDQKVSAMQGDLPVRHYVVASVPEYLRFPLNLLAPLKLRKQDPPLIAKVAPAPNLHRFKDLVKGAAPDAPAADVDLDDLAALQYTGGTTGVSKGAMLTHRNLSYNVQQIHAWFVGVKKGEEVILTALPLFHVFGMTVCMNWAVFAASKQVLMANPRDIPLLVKNVNRHRVSLLPAVPAMFNAINNHPGIDDVDISSVKACFSGSAPLPSDVQQRFESLSGSIVLEGFGMTETSPVTHVNPMLGKRKIGSIGIPFPDTDARCVDIETGREEVPQGEEGELVVRGHQVMKGYWQREEATAEAIQDGWMHTGDLAAMDEDGYFRIVGRKKDMIIAGGYNIYPDEIDDVLMAHDAILEAATIGVPDERRGETVKSFVVLQPGASLDAGGVEAYCRENLAAYKVPREVEFLDELPKSSVLKILRRELRDMEIAKRGG